MFKIVLPAEKILAANWWNGFLWGALAVIVLVVLVAAIRGRL